MNNPISEIKKLIKMGPESEDLIETQKKLAAKFPVEAIKFLILTANEYEREPGTKKISCLLAPYIDARDIENRLDQVIGFNRWQTEFTPIHTDQNSKTASFKCRISILGRVTFFKENLGNADGPEYLKSAVSDSFKRCAAHGLGIGRYLYDTDEIWAETHIGSKPTGDGWKYAARDRAGKYPAFYWRVKPSDLEKLK